VDSANNTCKLTLDINDGNYSNIKKGNYKIVAKTNIKGKASISATSKELITIDNDYLANVEVNRQSTNEGIDYFTNKSITFTIKANANGSYTPSFTIKDPQNNDVQASN